MAAGLPYSMTCDARLAVWLRTNVVALLRLNCDCHEVHVSEMSDTYVEAHPCFVQVLRRWAVGGWRRWESIFA